MLGGWRVKEGDKWRQTQAGVAYYQYGSVDRCSVCLLAVGSPWIGCLEQ